MEEEIRVLTKKNTIHLNDKQKEIYTTIGGTPHLDGAYTIFGEVTEGFNVIDSIAAQKNDAYDRPLTDIIMKIKELD